MRELGGMRVAAAGIGLAARRRQVDVRAGRERARVEVLDRPAAAHRRAARDEVGRRRRRRRATVRGHVDDVDGALLRRGRLWVPIRMALLYLMAASDPVADSPRPPAPS